MRKLPRLNRRIQSRVGSDVIFDGQIDFEGELLIAGQIRGRLFAPQGFLSIDHLATVSGEIEAQHSNVHGQLEGKVYCHRLCALLNGSTFKGALKTPAVEVAAGAVLQGDIQMLHAKQDAQIMQIPTSELRQHLQRADLLIDKVGVEADQQERKNDERKTAAPKKKKRWLKVKKDTASD